MSSSPASPVNPQYRQLDALSDIWAIAAQSFGETVALIDPHSQPQQQITFAQLAEALTRFACGLQSLGVLPGDRLSLFADNSPRWLIADQGCMLAGAVDVVRSSEADPAELAYILENSDSTVLIAENLKTLQKLVPFLPQIPLKWIGLLSDETPSQDYGVPVYSFGAIVTAGESADLVQPLGDRNQLATLLYTSGTTGKPKGVMLSHGNLLHQITAVPEFLSPQVGELALTILPTWHSFGRIVDYFLLSQGCTLVYTSIRHIKADLKDYRPHYMASVPRLWESLYEGIQKQFRSQPASKQRLVNLFFRLSERYIVARRIRQGLSLDLLSPSPLQTLGATVQQITLAPLHALGDKIVYGKVREALGGRFKLSLSGGGALAQHLENFFEIVGIELLVGYGLTETSPVLTARRPERNFRRSAGIPIAQTELNIVDPQTRQTLKLGEKGLVLARGPQVMQGYYHNPEATAKAIDPEGWFDTGDLGWMTPHQDLFLTGRAKDTIVLSNGENIEPEPLENACARSIYIDQIMVVGQDQRSLGALIVPNLEALQQWAIARNATLPAAALGDLPPAPAAATVLNWDSPDITELYRQELIREVKNRPGFRPDDRIGVFTLILDPFSMENGLLTQTLKVKRAVVLERYRDMINGMFA
ncbi:AMP-dependent synthetase/ligase [Lyngbya confervoides]|uniref:AMP-binding protein n=1 Tax=Lyngbya confervoides BDU141951 TaxID=1574623 RepID=A0ABD4T7X4_9CYAN|nr:AMP-binding protein [Lyngbya confervoides]MCM1984887.1 AMP-binding protein [Lyngbya confervoides BDU141951]